MKKSRAKIYFLILIILTGVLIGCSQPQNSSPQPQNNSSHSQQYPDQDQDDEFNEIVKSLDTPQKLSDFMKKYFSIEERGGCNAYEPRQFFELRRGDCKDYSAFSSLVLMRHGYNAQMLCFDLYSSEGVKSGGHVVTVFKEDGSWKYMSLYHINSASSIQDILEKEKNRLGYERVGDYEMVPAGSTYICPQYEPKGRE